MAKSEKRKLSPPPFFSVVIPTLNEEKALPQLLNDLQEQSWTNFSLYVVDGGSTDKTRDIVKKYATKDSRIHLLVGPAKNVSGQRNTGANAAEGKYLLFLDADSRIPFYYLEGMHVHLLRMPVDGWTNYAVPDSMQSKDLTMMKVQNTVLEGAARVGRPLCVGACLGIKKQAFTHVEGFDTSMNYMEDTDLCQRVYDLHHSFYVFREPQFTYSLRRFRKEGTLTIMRSFVPGILNAIQKKKAPQNLYYPMLGGAFFDQADSKKKTLHIMQDIEKRFRQLQHSRKKVVRWLLEDLTREI